MAAPEKIVDYLRAKGIECERIAHSETFSAVDEARTIGLDAEEVAKVLVLHGKRGPMLLALPASHRVDLPTVHRELGDPHARLATEEEMAQDLPGFELGSVPPIAELTGAPLYVDEHLLGHANVVFAAGTHRDSVRVKTAELTRLGALRVEVCKRAGIRSDEGRWPSPR